MDFMTTSPAWVTAFLIFGLRVVDVSMGTVRTVMIVEGRIATSVALGLCEVSVWVLAISQVIARLHESPWLIVGYASGFAAGNAAGILLEKRLALGSVVLRMVSENAGTRIADAFRERGQSSTVFSGKGNGSTVELIYLLCPRRELEGLLAIARDLDPDLFFVVERANQWGDARTPTFQPTGWRASLKKK